MKNKAIKEPLDVEVLEEQDLQLQATTKAILKSVEGIENDIETQAPLTVVGVEKVVEATNSGIFLDYVSDSTLDSSCPQFVTKTPNPHQSPTHSS